MFLDCQESLTHRTTMSNDEESMNDSIRGLEKSISRKNYNKRSRQKLMYQTFAIEYQNQMEEGLFVLGLSRLSKEACRLARKAAKEDELFVQKFLYSNNNKRSRTGETMHLNFSPSEDKRNDEESKTTCILHDETIDKRDEE